MPGPPLLPGPCEGVGARPRPAPKRGTDGPKLLPAGTDSSKEEGHPPHPRGSVQSNGGRHTPELYQCRKGENPPPPRTGREGGFSTPPGLPHCIEGGGCLPHPTRAGPLQAGRQTQAGIGVGEAPRRTPPHSHPLSASYLRPLPVLPPPFRRRTASPHMRAWRPLDPTPLRPEAILRAGK